MQITQTNKGGVKGQIEGLAGIEVFVPFSKLSTGNYGTQNPQSKTMKSLIGTTIGVKVVAVRETHQCLSHNLCTFRSLVTSNGRAHYWHLPICNTASAVSSQV